MLDANGDWILPWIDYLRWQFIRDRAYEPGQEYRWVTNESAPMTQMTKPLKDCRVTFWSQAAARTKDQEPWEEELRGEHIDDVSWREIPKNAHVKELVYRGSWMGYDAEQDPNLVFPLDRFRELEKEGFIGELAPLVFASHSTFHVRALTQKAAPKVVERLKDLKIDALFLSNN